VATRPDREASIEPGHIPPRRGTGKTRLVLVFDHACRDAVLSSPSFPLSGPVGHRGPGTRVDLSPAPLFLRPGEGSLTVGSSTSTGAERGTPASSWKWNRGTRPPPPSVSPGNRPSVQPLPLRFRKQPSEQPLHPSRAGRRSLARPREKGVRGLGDPDPQSNQAELGGLNGLIVLGQGNPPRPEEHLQ
jgi:hypothetical protein